MKPGDIVRIKWYGEWVNCIVVSLWTEGRRLHLAIPYKKESGYIHWDSDTRNASDCKKVRYPNSIKRKDLLDALLKRRKEIKENPDE